jgi:PEGA domain-containing protein
MKPILVAVVLATLAKAQIAIPEGTKLRVRLDQNISSATAEEGQAVELVAVEPVKVGEMTVIAEGARVTGAVTQAQEKRRMGRAGKLDFSIDRVKAVDNEWVPLRYTVTKKSGDSHAVRTGLITAGVAVVFWPAAPVALLMKGKDVTVNKGVAFDVFTDTNHILKTSPGPSSAHLIADAKNQSSESSGLPSVNSIASGAATVTVTSTIPGADIEVDGAFAGSTPTTLQLNSGPHRIVVKGNNNSWERTLHANAGSTVSLNAALK